MSQDLGRIFAQERGLTSSPDPTHLSFMDYPDSWKQYIKDTGKTRQTGTTTEKLYQDGGYSEWLPTKDDYRPQGGWGTGIGGVLSRIAPIIMAAGPALAMGNLPGAGIALAGASARSAGSGLPVSGALGTALNLAQGNPLGIAMSGYTLMNQIKQEQQQSALKQALTQRAQAASGGAPKQPSPLMASLPQLLQNALRQRAAQMHSYRPMAA